MLANPNYYAPLDPEALSSFASKSKSVVFDESSDIWALGEFTRNNNSLFYFQGGVQGLLRLEQEDHSKGQDIELHCFPLLVEL